MFSIITAERAVEKTMTLVGFYLWAGGNPQILGYEDKSWEFPL